MRLALALTSLVMLPSAVRASSSPATPIDPCVQVSVGLGNHSRQQVVVSLASEELVDFALTNAFCLELVAAATDNSTLVDSLRSSLAPKLVATTTIWQYKTAAVSVPVPPASSLLSGRHFKISAFGVAPYVMFNGRSVTGVDVDLFSVVADKFGFTFELKWGRFFGSRHPDTGEWNGLVGEIVSGESDFAVGALIATDRARRKAIGFTYTPYPVEFVLIAPWPRPHPAYLSLTKPFDGVVWTALVVALVLVSVLYWAIRVWSDGEQVVVAAWLIPYRSLTRQDVLPISIPSSHQLKPLALQPLLALWSLAMLVAAASYSGQLEAYLVSTEYEQEINQESDLIDLGKYLLLPRSAALYTNVATSPLDIHKRLLRDCLDNDEQGLYNMDKGWLPNDIEEERLMSEDGDGVLLFPPEPVLMRMPRMEAKYGVSNPLRTGDKVIFSSSTGYMLPKNAPYKEELDSFIGILVSMGFVEHFRNMYYPPTALLKQESAKSQHHDSFQRLTPEHFFGSLIVVAIGFAAALAVLAGEHAHSGSTRTQRTVNY